MARYRNGVAPSLLLRAHPGTKSTSAHSRSSAKLCLSSSRRVRYDFHTSCGRATTADTNAGLMSALTANWTCASSAAQVNAASLYRALSPRSRRSLTTAGTAQNAFFKKASRSNSAGTFPSRNSSQIQTRCSAHHAICGW